MLDLHPMKSIKPLFRRLFGFVLSPLEAGNEPFLYKPSHRVILAVMSILFSGLALAVFFIMPSMDSGYWLPIIVFGGAGVLAMIVALLGEDRAVAKLWGSK